MAKKKQHIDDFFKDQIHGSDRPLDGTEWNRLAEALAEKKKGRPFWLWLLIPGILLGSWFLYNSIVSLDPAHNQSLSEVNNDSSANEVNKSSLSSPLNQTPPVNPVQSSDPISEGGENQRKNEVTLTASDQNSDISNFSKYQPNSNSGGNDLPTDGYSDAADPADNMISIQDLPLRIHFLQVKEFPGFEHQIHKPSYKAEKTKFKLPRKSVLIGFKSGISLNQELNSGDPEYKDYRNKNDHLRLTTQFGLHLRLYTGRGFSIGTGLEVQQQGQSLGYAFSNSPELRIQLYDSVVVLDAQGDTIGFLPYNYRDSVVRHNIQNPTQSYIQIPFAVSKTFNVTGRFQVLAGLQLNSKFLLNAHGTAISPGLKGMNQNKDHFSSIGIGLGLNLGMAYYVSENIMMEVSGGSLFDLNNQSRIPDYTQRYGLYKLEFGLYYRIR